MSEKPNALITGASRGIGKAISIQMAEAGYHVILNYYANDQAAHDTLATIEQNGGSGELVKFDVSNRSAVQAALLPIFEAANRPIDVLVNNAGVIADSALVWMSESDWQRVIATNLDAFFYVTKIIVKRMIVQRRGRIISIASLAGQAGSRGQVNYSAAKAGVIAASKSLALEVATRGITVNVVSPGFIDTEMTADLPRKQILAHIPMRRFGRPEEVAAAVLFLAAPDSAYITGQVLAINGGMYL